MKTMNYVDACEMRIERIGSGVGLRVHLPDRCVLSARFKRIFPLSQPSSFYSIQIPGGEEVAVLKNSEELDPLSKQLLEEEIDRRYFTPQIEHILSLKQEAGMWHFKVGTQRGDIDFYVRNWRDNAFELGSGRWQIHSVDGARYEIVNLSRLDERSLKLLDQIL